MKKVEVNGKTYIITFLDENFISCEEKDASMVSIDEYDKNGKFIQNVLGSVDKNNITDDQ